MADTIFLLDQQGKLVEMTESRYLTEDEFQTLLSDYPKLISGEQIDRENPRKWLLIRREMGVADGEASSNRWSLDHLFIDQDGVPTLVEVKRSTDTRIRREVIGQMLDYAANAVSYWSVEEMKHQFGQTCNEKGKDCEEVLNDFLNSSVESQHYWDMVNTNLKAGKIRLLLVADTIPREMRRIIEFLNEQMTPCEILGIEIKQFIGANNLKTLVPRVIGATAAAQDKKMVKSTPAQQWDEIRFFEAVSQRFPAHVNTYREIFETSKILFDNIWWGQGARNGSFIPNLNKNGKFIQLFGVYTSSIEIQFQWLKSKEPFISIYKREELKNKLNTALGTTINTIELRPNLKIEVFEKPGAINAFFDVVRWYINEVNAYYR